MYRIHTFLLLSLIHAKSNYLLAVSECRSRNFLQIEFASFIKQKVKIFSPWLYCDIRFQHSIRNFEIFLHTLATTRFHSRDIWIVILQSRNLPPLYLKININLSSILAMSSAACSRPLVFVWAEPPLQIIADVFSLGCEAEINIFLFK